MIDYALIQMTQLQAAKETDHKLRWDAEIGDTRFSLYIPQWRVPRPWPSKIWVRVLPWSEEGGGELNLPRMDESADLTWARKPIVATIEKRTVHTKTIRYAPVGDPENWEIGEPYLPLALTYDEAEKLRIIVAWDVTGGETFQDRTGVGG